MITKFYEELIQDLHSTLFNVLKVQKWIHFCCWILYIIGDLGFSFFFFIVLKFDPELKIVCFLETSVWPLGSELGFVHWEGILLGKDGILLWDDGILGLLLWYNSWRFFIISPSISYINSLLWSTEKSFNFIPSSLPYKEHSSSSLFLFSTSLSVVNALFMLRLMSWSWGGFKGRFRVGNITVAGLSGVTSLLNSWDGLNTPCSSSIWTYTTYKKKTNK